MEIQHRCRKLRAVAKVYGESAIGFHRQQVLGREYSQNAERVVKPLQLVGFRSPDKKYVQFFVVEDRSIADIQLKNG